MFHLKEWVWRVHLSLPAGRVCTASTASPSPRQGTGVQSKPGSVLHLLVGSNGPALSIPSDETPSEPSIDWIERVEAVLTSNTLRTLTLFPIRCFSSCLLGLLRRVRTASTASPHLLQGSPIPSIDCQCIGQQHVVLTLRYAGFFALLGTA